MSDLGNPPTDGPQPRYLSVRVRMDELVASGRRHPRHDGPTVCSCAECVLWTLLSTVLADLDQEDASKRRFDESTRWPR